MTTLTISGKVTPMMEQWLECKKQAGNAILLFRLGDFYEAFESDAELLSRELDLTLTQRQGIPMSGVPHHSSQNYIEKLVYKGYRVAVAEQMEDPRLVKGLVKRKITKIFTSGTLFDSSTLQEKQNQFLISLTQVGSFYGLSSLDLTTGEFKAAEVDKEEELLNELVRLKASELLCTKKFKEKHPKLFKEINLYLSAPISEIEEMAFDHKQANLLLNEHFETLYLDQFGLKGMVAAVNAAGALLDYIKNALQLPATQIKKIVPYSVNDSLLIDCVSQRHLELFDSPRGKEGTLLKLIDYTITPMGGRLLRSWLKSPLLNIDEIKKRQDAIEVFLSDRFSLSLIQKMLKPIRDVERLMVKVCCEYATPKDVAALRDSFKQFPFLKEQLSKFNTPLLSSCAKTLESLKDLTALLAKQLMDEPPLKIGDSPTICGGVSKELDEMRALMKDGKQWIANYQNQLKEQTGIKTLKVGFNNIFGYFIEVSRGQAQNVPSSFQRKQTLANSERYTTPELKEYEEKVLHAEECLATLEIEAFKELCKKIAEHHLSIQKSSDAIGCVDTVASLAHLAIARGYIKPNINIGDELIIREGRHPVLESQLSHGSFISNDTFLSKNEQLMLITGPNMGGKSTYIRQVALIVILAQIGSFVPAKEAKIGVIDKLFTRIGSSDDLTRGQSTFMVEMSETAHILQNITSRSLVILDEIGRGTSTYDGLSIAWAVAEHLLKTEGKCAKTLFATHYGELTQLEKSLPNAVNYHASVCERQDTIVFLYKIVKGMADRSYGIHVARLAGLPFSVIQRAQQLLTQLEANGKKEKKKDEEKKEKQLSLFDGLV